MKSGSRTKNILFAAGSALVVLAAVMLAKPSHAKAAADNVTARPGDNIAQMVESHPGGTTFNFRPGVYRMQSVSPKDGDSFIGQPGAVFNGAAILTAFTQKGDYWSAKVKVARASNYRGECDSQHPACAYPQDLFIDNVPLRRVAENSEVGPGSWCLDYGSGEADIGDDPKGHTVEMSEVPFAFYGSARDITIRGLTIEKYAEAAGDGAIEGRSSSGQLSQGWTVQGNLIEFNHGMGIRLGNGMQVLDNKVEHNGQMGIGGSGGGILVAKNEIAYNNYAGYDYGWEAGGTKFAFTSGLVVRDNTVHNNNGPGLWTDINNHNTLYENNRTWANKEAGILHEISFHAVIRGNTIENDGFDDTGKTAPWYGGGILVTDSENVEIYGNTVTDCMNGIVGLQSRRKNQAGGYYTLRNLNVHDNVITQNSGIAAGIMNSLPFDHSVFTSWNNRFSNNTFHLAGQAARYFTWIKGPETLAAWRSHFPLDHVALREK